MMRAGDCRAAGDGASGTTPDRACHRIAPGPAATAGAPDRPDDGTGEGGPPARECGVPLNRPDQAATPAATAAAPTAPPAMSNRRRDRRCDGPGGRITRGTGASPVYQPGDG